MDPSYTGGRRKSVVGGILPGALAMLCLLSGCTSRKSAPETTRITVDGHGAGRIFDGIGALSAGASSRLLVDYPEPFRAQILDYLFKPDYGAALQHLKVEIGADVNSTDGAEPSFARTRAEMAHPNFNRGYEWWLMEEAKKRNPEIALDSLAWGAPGWIANGHFYSQDMADYTGKFIEGAKTAHGLDIKYTGIWNEKPYEADYVVRLKRTLLKNQLSTGIVCCDLTPNENQWSRVTDDMGKDPEFRNAISVIGVHAPNVVEGATVPSAARESGKPLWASEDEFFYYTSGLSEKWSPFAESLAMIYNRNYIQERITATEIWSPVTSYYDNLAAPGSGLMLANTPWSGHFEISPMVWVTAHTTQFAAPGWQYIDSSCAPLAGGGSYVTLKSPSNTGYSMIVETINAKEAQRIEVHLTGGLSQGPAHVWETNASKTFEHVADISPRDGTFNLMLDQDSIYSITDTTGQAKGAAAPPPPAPFPFPYADDFEHTEVDRSPRYFADQDGAFEVRPCKQRPGRCLDQVITRQPIPWSPLPDPYTYLGDAHWQDYTLSADALLSGLGDITLLGRIDDADVFKDHKARFPSGYILLVDQNGSWQLDSAAYKLPTVKLGSGKVSFDLRKWHHLVLAFHGEDLVASIDGTQLTHLTDTRHKQGMAGIGSGWNRAEFDNFDVH
ncbi:MAG: galactosylceramidase [Acidobacteria bacterium]|nr:MAG: galactosylceramidase [Acidobacteriota bacterium]